MSVEREDSRKTWKGRAKGAIGAYLGLSFSWTLSYLFTDRVLKLDFPGIVMQLINSAFGLIIFWGVIFLYVKLMLRESFRERQREAFKPLIDALDQIAEGNYKVSIALEDDNPYSEVAKKVNEVVKGLDKVEQMRQEFISDVSHEIQTPLTSINGFAQALQTKRLTDEETQRYLSIIENESRRLSHMSDNLLKLASLDSDQHPFAPKTYRLDKQLRRVILSCEPQWMAKDIQIEVDFEDIAIEGDEDLLDQVWVNLFFNAIKFTPPGGQITLALSQQIDGIHVTISDTGIGMTPEEIDRIFERFYKSDKSRDRSLGGNGLGLSIVAKIIQMHDGTINVTSQKGTGSTFTVVFKS